MGGGEGLKNCLPEEEGREGGEKIECSAPPGEGGLEPRTYHMLGEGPQLHVTEVV